ncbi:MAG: hypothetical protein JEY79_14100 [Pseudodesulfovibrio sp.]|nr:hypothetical protein [Pseudodesulfovibrio sp.]
MTAELSSKIVIDKTSTFFRRCLDIFGMGTMKDVCRRSQAQVYKYAEETAHKDSSYQNPVDLILDLFSRLVQAGRRDVAVDLVRLMADRIGLDVAEREEIIPDKATMHEEIFDDHDTLNIFYNELTQPRRVERIQHVKSLAYDCKHEIDENVAKYIEEAEGASR